MIIHKENTSGTFIYPTVKNVALQDIASFLNIAPTYLGKLRKENHIPSAPVNMMTKAS